MAYVKFLRELVQNWGIAVLVFLDDRNDQGDQLVPKVHAVQLGTVVCRVPLSFPRIRLREEKRRQL